MLNDIAERDGIRKFNRLVELTGISANTFTNIKRNEVKEVSIESFNKLNSAFGNRYNLRWFQGDSPYMLIKDYQNAQKDMQTAIPEYSSLLNATLAAKDETIASYQRQLEVTEKRLEDKDATIESLRGQLADKDDHIATLKARIAELRRIIDAHNLTDAIMPYPMGSAESGKRQTKRK